MYASADRGAMPGNNPNSLLRLPKIPYGAFCEKTAKPIIVHARQIAHQVSQIQPVLCEELGIRFSLDSTSAHAFKALQPPFSTIGTNGRKTSRCRWRACGRVLRERF